MKKAFFTLLAAGALVFSSSATDAQDTVQAQQPTTEVAQKASEPAIVQVSNSTYKFKYATNVRRDAGTSHGVIKVASKGATATVTKSATIGSGKWFKVRTGGTHGWVHSSLVSKSSGSGVVQASAKTASVSSSAVVSKALALKGIPYRFGGTTTAGFDCSGFVQYAFKKAGKSVSRTTLSQYAQSYKVSSPRPGDLVFFANTYRPGISHVGIYIGNNQFVHSGGSKAEVKSLSGPYWGKKFHSFKRFK
ncbi:MULTISPECIES: C40 family peptidase [unclassified Planococcus (in: firmicutes)]|uniref:C40 family peptidase n=1 Tax=Planococcus TaxID=1372 RepID=UPI000C7D02A5|nr:MULTISPECIES: C40 family peptidase [unclassified Planococcus (in: firmicutes)]PKG44782.1 peptidoglycan hydrolase [Planococcus sp. Urea-trap-24]PKG87124.1 peptidoglycan hydrolase [Planococcus sp. Urea-3u-39]PKH40228.1 peptidoglycan hydrolase [Planococcus sp. MB-3u-09]